MLGRAHLDRSNGAIAGGEYGSARVGRIATAASVDVVDGGDLFVRGACEIGRVTPPALRSYSMDIV
jgi:hypothetical protein